MTAASMHRLFILLALLGGLSTFNSARAAESYDACVGFIDSVPTTITRQGTWCLRKDVSTNIVSGNAITIATNNVTIDCNGFKIGGLAAGAGSHAYGIAAYGRQNATVRHCNIRGFNTGITLNGGAGHLVEDNRLDNNLFYGIFVAGDNNRISRNVVYDTGGSTGATSPRGISGYADIVDNTVSGLFASAPGGTLYAIQVYAAGARIHGNTVSNLDMTAVQGGSVGNAIGLELGAPRMRASSNQIAGGESAINGHGIRVSNASSAYCVDNTVGGFATNIHASCVGTGNVTAP